MLQYSKYLFYTLIFFIAVACKKDNGDNPSDVYPEKPEIEILSVSPEVITAEICGQQDNRAIELQTGESLELEFRIQARAGVAQYKIDIHSNFDCHSHRTDPNNTTPWKVLTIKETSGQEIVAKEILTVPENATAGNYHFMLQALDTEGYEAEFVIYSLKVSN